MAGFYQSFGLFQYDACHFYMIFGWFIKSGCNDLSMHASFHVWTLFSTFVDEEYNHVTFRMVGCDSIGNILEQECFTGLGLGNDQSTLSFSNSSKQADHSIADIAPGRRSG